MLRALIDLSTSLKRNASHMTANPLASQELKRRMQIKTSTHPDSVEVGAGAYNGRDTLPPDAIPSSSFVNKTEESSDCKTHLHVASSDWNITTSASVAASTAQKPAASEEHSPCQKSGRVVLSDSSPSSSSDEQSLVDNAMPLELSDPLRWLGQCKKESCCGKASDTDQPSIPRLEKSLNVIKKKFVWNEERRRRQRQEHSTHTLVDDSDDDTEDEAYDPLHDTSQPTISDHVISKSDLGYISDGGLSASDDEGYSADQAYVAPGVSEEKARLHSGQYVQIMLKNIENDETRKIKVSKAALIEMLENPCELCGRVHKPGVNRVNSVDRLFSFVRLYKGRWLITLCPDCNFIKGTLDPAELLEQALAMVSNYKSLLPLCEEINTLAELEQRINEDSDTPFASEMKKSISDERKGDLDQLFEKVAPRYVADLKTQPCTYCDTALAFGVDRQDSSVSYPIAVLNDQAVPCCSKCNCILKNFEREDVLVQFCRVIIHIAENWVPSSQLANIFFSPTEGMLSFNNGERKPWKCIIDGVVIMFPSMKTMRSFAVPEGTKLFAATPFEFNTWEASLNDENVAEIRRVLDIHTDHGLTNALLLKMDAHLEEKTARTQTKKKKKKKVTLPSNIDEKKPRHTNTNRFSNDRFDQAPIVVKKKRRGNVAIRSLDSSTLYAVVSSGDEAARVLPVSNTVIFNAFDNGTPVSSGQDRYRQEICRVDSPREGEELGVTPAGKAFFGRNTIKYPSGVTIETKGGRVLACCKRGTHAAGLLNVDSRTYYHYLDGRRSHPNFNVRKLTDEDSLGVTKRGRRELPGYEDIEHEYLY